MLYEFNLVSQSAGTLTTIASWVDGAITTTTFGVRDELS
jgi:hypothetical protein